jgi:hypothetical protein
MPIRGLGLVDARCNVDLLTRRSEIEPVNAKLLAY